MEWMLMPYRRYFDFSGRSRRIEYWMFMLFNILVMFGLMALMLGFGFGLGNLQNIEAMGSPPASLFVFALFLALFWLFTIIPSIAVTVRRLHDRDMSGWFYLGFILVSWIPIVGIIVSIAFLVLMFLEGTKGPNKYGPDPKDPTSADVFS